jgi:predicted CXXCH cytochrome family protein
MKTKVLIAVAVLAGVAATAQAGIVGTKHDLSSVTGSANTIRSQNQNQTCVFCHAPHNAITNKLLWNRNFVAGSGMKIYTSYNTSGMRGKLTQNTLGDDSSSLLCLSCHSLTTAANVIDLTANSKGGGLTTSFTSSATFPSKTGGMTNLTNDHPVGIDYAAAFTEAAGTLNAIGSINGLRLFNSAVAPSTMECASCHAVHDNTNKPFLAMNNDGSALCVSCHAK